MKTTIWVFWAMAIVLISCETLKVIKEEGRGLVKEVSQDIDAIGTRLVRSYTAKIRKEFDRARVTLTDKARAEIDRWAYSVGLDKTKPLTKAERREIRIRLEATKTLPAYQKIVNPYTAGPTVLQKWEPDEELRKDFFKHNPRGKGGRQELQMIFMAIHSIGVHSLIYHSTRTCKQQKDFYKRGVSKINDCSKGMHLKKPKSFAYDVVPIAVGGKADWNDRITMGYIGGLAKVLSCQLARQHGWGTVEGYRFGGDFDGDQRVAEKGTFVDLLHHEYRPLSKVTCH